jgi:imidazolonepropionase-like amidohydrolase/ABC-type multidrug transport system permease subunit
MNAYWTLIRTEIRLTLRQRTVIFFSYLMPLVFFFVFAQSFHAEQGGAILQVVCMVTVIGILGSGFFGAGMRAVQEREANILRRYKVAPISPLPLLMASMVTGLVVYMPYLALMFTLSKVRYGMVVPQHMWSLVIFVMLGVVAFRSLGLIVASVVNSMQESGILMQILYMTMLFLSGASFPLAMFPGWLLVVTQFIPATWLMTGMQGIMLRNESLSANWQAAGALILTAAVGLLLCVKLFRWEKEEKMRPAAKLWVLAVLAPFVLLGTWQVHAKDNVSKTKVISRDLARSRTVLLRNARIFVGDGKVIENGAVLVKAGKIAEVYEGNIPDPKTLNAQPIEAAGKTILPGFIDMHVHLDAPAGIYDDWKDYDPAKMMQRNLAAYLYSGVTAVKSVGDQMDLALKTRELVNSGEKQGAEFFTVGPLFTAAGGHGTEILKTLPAVIRDRTQGQLVRLPTSAEEAKQQVDGLKTSGVDGIKAVLEGGAGGAVFNRLDSRILDALAAQAHAGGLSIVVHTGDERDVEDALRARVDGIEHGSYRRRIPDGDFTAMAKAGVTYDPTLSAAEAIRQLADGKPDLLNRSLVQQVGPPALLAGTKHFIESRKAAVPSPIDLDVARDNLRRAYWAGVTLITGTDAGSMLVIHGPTVQRELELWVEAGIPVAAALRAATWNAAKALHADKRFGSIEKGKEATMLVVDGNPLQDIKATEAISFVMFKGERVDRADLFRQE